VGIVMSLVLVKENAGYCCSTFAYCCIDIQANELAYPDGSLSLTHLRRGGLDEERN